MIRFNIPPVIGNEINFIKESISNGRLAGNNQFTKKCQTWFENTLKCKKALLTTSCTHALEMIAILIDIKKGDEVIMPSYTFVSTANAFVLRGAKIIFIDIRPDTMNINETKIEQAITSKTKAIVAVHYAGISCEMDTIVNIASKHNLFIIEDAAQGMMSAYKGQALGTIGHFGAFSFHETKNYTSAGEGGLLIINDEKFINRAEIIREKGTNRSLFFRGMVDKYSWIDIGSSYLMNDISAAYLWGQLEYSDKINQNRLNSWDIYINGLKELNKKGFISIPNVPKNCNHNAHMFYIKVKNIKIREKLLAHFKKNDIMSVFHYIPLHSSGAGLRFSTFYGDDEHTTIESEKLIRLPLYYNITKDDIKFVISTLNFFYRN